MNLVLIGYRGTGKSTIGKLAADLLEFEYVGLDDEIVRMSGMSIPEIVEKYSWDYFRDLESDVVAQYSLRNDQVLDTGGGVVIRPKNTEHLKKNGILVLLKASLEDITQRIGTSDARPSLTGNKDFLEEIEEVLAARRPLYETAADFVVDTSKMPPAEAVATIATRFKQLARERER